jgi:hypothetical protein
MAGAVVQGRGTRASDPVANEVSVLTTDEWIFFGILTFIIYGIGGWPRIAARLFGGAKRASS